MELYGTYDIRVRPTCSLEMQLAEVAEQVLELTEEDGYSQVCCIVQESGDVETQTVYVYVGDIEDE